MLYHKDNFVEIHHGHALEVLKQMPGESVDCVVTSPPYWGLRTYKTEPIIWDGDDDCEHEWGDLLPRAGYRSNDSNPGKLQNVATQNRNTKDSQFCLKCNAWRGELGLEPTIELYIQHLILIFNEVKRVLKKTGTCWVNLDDSYASGKGTCFNPGGGKGSYSSHGDRKDAGVYPLDRGNISMLKAEGLLPKSLCLIPQRFALAMIENGWILRNDIVWNKPNPMPESVKDRFTGSWEHLFFFIKNNQAVYWTNSKTFKITDKQPLGTHGVENEDWEWIEHSSCEGKGCNNKRCVSGKIKSSLWEGHDYWFEQQFEPHISNDTYPHGTFGRKSLAATKKIKIELNPQGRNKRDVWTIPTAPYPEAHFATFPEKLCEIPILAGCPSMICKKCGKAREKIIHMECPEHYDPSPIDTEYQDNCRKASGAKGTNRPLSKMFKDSLGSKRVDSGYTDCGCNAGFEPGVMLDPFCGSGAALAAAKKLGRKSIGIDLNPKYCGLTVKRLEEIPLPMF